MADPVVPAAAPVARLDALLKPHQRLASNIVQTMLQRDALVEKGTKAFEDIMQLARENAPHLVTAYEGIGDDLAQIHKTLSSLNEQLKRAVEGNHGKAQVDALLAHAQVYKPELAKSYLAARAELEEMEATFDAASQQLDEIFLGEDEGEEDEPAQAAPAEKVMLSLGVEKK